jgi:hypothetical protein
MKNRTLLFIFSIIVILSSCNQKDEELVLLKVSELGPAKVSDSTLAVIMEEELGRKVRVEYTLSEDTALKKLEDHEVDLAIIPNNIEGCLRDKKLRTITPLLPRLLMILAYNIPDAHDLSLKDLLENHNVVFEEMSRLDSIFIRTFFITFNITTPDAASYFFVHDIDGDKWRDSSFVYIGLTHMHNPVMRNLIENGADFISLDDVSNLGKGSSVEGLKSSFPKLRPFIIPKSIYLGMPEEPVLTIAITDILVACKALNKYLVYDIVKLINEKRSELISEDNTYNMLDPKTSDFILSFPLHQGAKAYQNRDKPSVWTRYASVLWPFLSIIAIIAGALASLSRHIKQRKKMRIDTIYTELLTIRKRAYNNQDDSSREQLLKEMRNIRTKAFDALMNNKLSANESFMIFLSLYSEVMEEIIKLGEKKKD